MRIVWKDSIEKLLQIFRLKTVTYGTASAPFLATRIVQQLANDEKNNYPTAAKVIKKDFYMDDLLTGTNSLQDAKLLQDDLISICSKGGFKLRKWASNNTELVNHLPVQDTENKGHFSTDQSTKTLGLLWKSNSDMFHYSIGKQEEQYVVTKRNVLSDLSQIFDPLGLIAPVILQGKVFMQSLWQLNIGWDEPLPIEKQKFWQVFKENLIHLNHIQVQRKVFGAESSCDIQIHGFSDASELAYGATIYIRQVDSNGHVHTRLLCSKSRVAPVNKISLPRLELCAALLLARLVSKVVSILNIVYSLCTLWSDSTIVLSWINASPSHWKTFVGNRVSEIQALHTHCNWRHVRSFDNPADTVSRGASPVEFKNNDLWWYGPNWLHLKSSSWPALQDNSPEEIQEECKIIVTYIQLQMNLY